MIKGQDKEFKDSPFILLQNTILQNETQKIFSYDLRTIFLNQEVRAQIPDLYVFVSVQFQNVDYSVQRPVLIVTNNSFPTPQYFVQEKFKNGVNLPLFDYTAYTTFKAFHFLTIPIYKIFYNTTGILKVGVFDVKQSQNSSLVYDIFILISNVQHLVCPQDCTTDLNGVCQLGQCICAKQFFDLDCSLRSVQMITGQQYNFKINPMDWYYYYIEVVANDSSILISLQPNIYKLHLSVVFYEFDLQYRPNTIDNYYSIYPHDQVDTFKIMSFSIKFMMQQYNKNINQFTKKPTVLLGFYNPNQFEVYQNVIAVYDYQESIMDEDSQLFNVFNIFIIVLSCLICMTIIYICYRRCKRRQLINQPNANQNLALQNVNNNRAGFKKKPAFVQLSQKLINQYMPSQIYTQVIQQFPNITDNQECVICLVSFEQEAKVRLTICFHFFHLECIDAWLQKHDTCPSCRFKLTKDSIKNKNQQNNNYINFISKKSEIDKKSQNSEADKNSEINHNNKQLSEQLQISNQQALIINQKKSEKNEQIQDQQQNDNQQNRDISQFNQQNRDISQFNQQNRDISQFNQQSLQEKKQSNKQRRQQQDNINSIRDKKSGNQNNTNKLNQQNHNYENYLIDKKDDQNSANTNQNIPHDIQDENNILNQISDILNPNQNENNNDNIILDDIQIQDNQQQPPSQFNYKNIDNKSQVSSEDNNILVIEENNNHHVENKVNILSYNQSPQTQFNSVTNIQQQRQQNNNNPQQIIEDQQSIIQFEDDDQIQ